MKSMGWSTPGATEAAGPSASAVRYPYRGALTRYPKLTELPKRTKTPKPSPAWEGLADSPRNLPNQKAGKREKMNNPSAHGFSTLSVHLRSRSVDGTSDPSSLSVLFPSHPWQDNFALEGMFLRGQNRFRQERKPKFCLILPGIAGTTLCCGCFPPSVLEERWPPVLGRGVVLAAEAVVVVEEEEVLGQTLVSTTFR